MLARAVVCPILKQANLFALDGFGIRVAISLYETGETKKVYESYGVKHVPLE